MAQSYNTWAKNLEFAMDQEALSKVTENIINNINDLKDQVLNLERHCDKGHPWRKSKMPHQAWKIENQII